MLTASAETLAARFHASLGYWPDIENPRTIQEKILWRKLREDMSEAVRLADKVAVRDYVRDVVGAKYLIEDHAVVDDPEDLNFDAFPDSFIVKLNRSSGTNIVVKDKSQLDFSALRRLLRGLMRIEFGRRRGEHWYAAMQPKILVQLLLVDNRTTIPADYRFHVFHGKVQYLQISDQKVFADEPSLLPGMGAMFVENRHTTSRYYDVDWQPAPFHTSVSPPAPPLDKTPDLGEEMIAVAETLAGDWGYVRVDLYCLNDREVYFGELTFAPASGHFRYVPEPYNEIAGSLWDIERRYVRSERLPWPVLA